MKKMTLGLVLLFTFVSNFYIFFVVVMVIMRSVSMVMINLLFQITRQSAARVTQTRRLKRKKRKKDPVERKRGNPLSRKLTASLDAQCAARS